MSVIPLVAFILIFSVWNGEVRAEHSIMESSDVESLWNSCSKGIQNFEKHEQILRDKYEKWLKSQNNAELKKKLRSGNAPELDLIQLLWPSLISNISNSSNDEITVSAGKMCWAYWYQGKKYLRANFKNQAKESLKLWKVCVDDFYRSKPIKVLAQLKTCVEKLQSEQPSTP